MPKYQVRLSATVDVEYSLEIEAPDEETAQQMACDQAPVGSSFWKDFGGQVFGMEAVSAEELEG